MDKIKEKIGLFGGTFSPPHLGHVHAVRTMFKNIPLDKIIVMPTAIPPHKVKISEDTPALRLEMCRAAFGDIPNVEVSDFEITKGGISYTYETLEYLSRSGREIHFLCGTDMFLTLGSWKRPEKIFEFAKIVCVSRYSADSDELERQKIEYKNTFSADVTIIEAEPFEISSTEVRKRIKNGEDLVNFLPEKVIEIIKRENLYGK